MVTAEVLREDIRKLTQKAQEYLQQENFDGARAYQEQIKLLRQELDDFDRWGRAAAIGCALLSGYVVGTPA